jgi:arylamine N-acetyltransferase
MKSSTHSGCPVRLFNGSVSPTQSVMWNVDRLLTHGKKKSENIHSPSSVCHDHNIQQIQNLCTSPNNYFNHTNNAKHSHHNLLVMCCKVLPTQERTLVSTEYYARQAPWPVRTLFLEKRNKSLSPARI